MSTIAIDGTNPDHPLVTVDPVPNMEQLEKDFEGDELNTDPDSVFGARENKVWAVYNSITPIFKMIFNHRECYYLTNIVDKLRMYSHVGYLEQETEVHRESFALLKQIAKQAEEISRVMFKGKLFGADTEEEDQGYRETLAQMKMSLYRFQKKWRKESRPVSYAFLTPGTVIERFIDGVDKESQIYTVKHISDATVGHVIITTEEKVLRKAGWYGFFPYQEHETFNSAHVTRIIKHVPGNVVVEDYRAEKDDKYTFNSRPGKSKGTYLTYFHSDLMINTWRRIFGTRDLNECHDLGLLSLKVIDRLGLNYPDNSDGWDLKLIEIRKKKWARALRQLNRKFLLTRQKQEQKEEEYQREMSREFDLAYDEESPKEEREEEAEANTSVEPSWFDVQHNAMVSPSVRHSVLDTEMDPGI